MNSELEKLVIYAFFVIFIHMYFHDNESLAKPETSRRRRTLLALPADIITVHVLF